MYGMQPGGGGGAAPAPRPAAPAAGASAQSPLLRIRAGIENGNVAEVQAGVQEADINGVELAPNVRQMITQWLSVNAPGGAGATAPAAAAPAAAPQASAQPQKEANEDGVRQGEGAKNWESSPAPVREGGSAAGAVDRNASLSPELMRMALMKFFGGAPRASDAAKGLGMIEKDNGDRFLPLPYVGKVLGVKGQDFEIAMAVYSRVNAAPAGIFIMSDDARGVGLVEWAGWQIFNANLDAIVKGTQDPAFEPRSILMAVASCAHGAVRSGIVRQAEVLDRLSQSLSPSSLPEETAPALRSAIARRARLALACLTDCIAHKGLGAQAGPDALGLVGQLPRRLFGAIFDNLDDRDRGACAFLGEILQSWDRRKSFSKKWLQDAASKFSMPKGANPERDEGRGWYALTAENIEKQKLEPLMPVEVAAPAAAAETAAPAAAAAPAAPAAGAAAQSADAVVIVDSAPRKEGKASKISAESLAEDGGAGSEAPAQQDAGAKKKRRIMQDEEDDETVAQHLEESRKRRAAMMAKHTKD